MDTSDKYIKMCRTAQEIQPPIQHYDRNIHEHDISDPFIDGDVLWDGENCFIYGGDGANVCRYDDERITISTDGFCEGDGYNVDEIVWIPRQDQLQKMEDDGASAYGKLIRFYSFIKHNPFLQNNQWSWEQLWLIYIMRWKFNKIWNGTKWELRG